MPGIVGIIDRGLAPGAAKQQVSAMVECMMHEGFYASGTCSFPDHIGIHAGWVAHEGSMAADQVFWNERQDVALLFAGECFVDPGVRSDLKRAGHDVGNREGDWLVHLYEEKAEKFFESLNGLFSGLLVDLRQRSAYLFNDRYGIERLYWFETGEATYFATEAKALLRVIPELRTFDEEGVADFLAFGCTLEWKTLFRGMRLGPGSSLWRIKNGECRKSRYFDQTEWESLPILPDDAFQAKFQESFTRLLPRYFASDSEVGISLTGGLDTRMIMACGAWKVAHPVCYTFVGQKGRTLDARVAARVAKVSGLDHRLLQISSDFFEQFAAIADRAVCITDGCFGICGAHEIYLNGLARQLAPVRITGNFGSEVLRSMSTFKPLGLSAELFLPEFRSWLARSERAQSMKQKHPVAFAAFSEIPWSLFGSLAAGRSQVVFRTPYLDNEIVSLAFQAPESLRRSTAQAIKFIKENASSLASIPTDRGQGGDGILALRHLRQMYAALTFKLDYYCSEGLPYGLAKLDSAYGSCNSMLGFQGMHKYLTYRSWLRRELAGYVEDRLDTAAKASIPYIDPKVVGTLARDHIAGRKNLTREINAVLSLEAVQRLLFVERVNRSQ